MDKDHLKVRHPWNHAPSLDDTSSLWFRTPQLQVAGSIAESNDEVLLGLEHGDYRKPYVLGSLYNGAGAPPSRSTGGSNASVMDDTAGSETVGGGRSETVGAETGQTVSHVELKEASGSDGDWLIG